MTRLFGIHKVFTLCKINHAGKETTKEGFRVTRDASFIAHPAGAEPAQQTSQDDDEQGSGSGSDREISFGSMNEAEANMFVGSVENMHEKQQGLLPDGKLHIPTKAREAFVSMYSRLRKTNYDDDACVAVLDLLTIGVDKESLMQQLPALSKAITSTTDSVKLSTTESSAIQAKLQAIRDTVLPSAEEIKQQLK